jgi:hypothetical protein
MIRLDVFFSAKKRLLSEPDKPSGLVALTIRSSRLILCVVSARARTTLSSFGLTGGYRTPGRALIKGLIFQQLELLLDGTVKPETMTIWVGNAQNQIRK